MGVPAHSTLGRRMDTDSRVSTPQKHPAQGKEALCTVYRITIYVKCPGRVNPQRRRAGYQGLGEAGTVSVRGFIQGDERKRLVIARHWEPTKCH